ncbi:MAG: heavy-metal-associated domain-containing protein [Thermomicrobiales bacterium]
MEVQTFRVPDVSCDHCVRAITVELTKLTGVDRVEVDLDGQTVTVEHDGTVSALEMQEGIAEAGYEVTV